ncbi:MAG: hypothetical protein ILA34_00620 [Bacteroidaceae bacterium]|nr:hypothetical protein [Bacteroidaceae bacterium]
MQGKGYAAHPVHAGETASLARPQGHVGKARGAVPPARGVKGAAARPEKFSAGRKDSAAKAQKPRCGP